jgi:hypothetical protein
VWWCGFLRGPGRGAGHCCISSPACDTPAGCTCAAGGTWAACRCLKLHHATVQAAPPPPPKEHTHSHHLPSHARGRHLAAVRAAARSPCARRRAERQL